MGRPDASLQMPERDLIELFVEPLNRGGFRYLVSGSVAAMLYGEPRITHDVELLLFLPADRVREFAGLFPKSDFYVPPVEVLLTENDRDRGAFQPDPFRQRVESGYLHCPCRRSAPVGISQSTGL